VPLEIAGPFGTSLGTNRIAIDAGRVFVADTAQNVIVEVTETGPVEFARVESAVPDGGAVEPEVPVSVDASGGYLYFTTIRGVYRCPLSGCGSPKRLAVLRSPASVAPHIKADGDTSYWIDREDYDVRILRCTGDCSSANPARSPQIIASMPGYTSELTLGGGYLYWVADYVVYRRPAAPSGERVKYVAYFGSPGGMDVDTTASRLFAARTNWNGALTSCELGADVCGPEETYSGRTGFVTEIRAPYDVHAAAGYVFWGARRYATVLRCEASDCGNTLEDFAINSGGVDAAEAKSLVSYRGCLLWLAEDLAPTANPTSYLFATRLDR
jgi:hypothetical protein